MKIGCQLNIAAFTALEKDINDSVAETAEAVRVDVTEAQTMPYQESKEDEKTGEKIIGGTLQNLSTFVRKNKDGTADIVSDTPYARRLYFNPEYNFFQGENPHAGGEWFEPYISGEKKNFAAKVFERILRTRLK